MVNFALLNLILYNSLEHDIKSVIILHCWGMTTQLYFANMTMNKNISLQMWPINHIELESDLEFHILKRLNPPLVGVYFDINCTNSVNILQKASKEKLYKSHFHWFIFDIRSDLNIYKDIFKDFQMAVDADVTLAQLNTSLINTDQNSSYVLYDVYNNGYNLGGKLNVLIDRELVCSKKQCELKKYLSSLHERTKYQQRWALTDITMRVSVVVTTVPLTAPEDEILAHLSSEKDKHIDGVAKFGFQYALILKEALKCEFRYKFYNSWSVTEATGGAIGALGVEEAADMMSSSFICNEKRMKYVQPLTELGYFRQIFIFRTPRNAGIKADVFLRPFSIRVWELFGVLLLLAAFLLWLTFVVETHKMKTFLKFVPSLLTTCLISFGSACCQGSFLIPGSVGGRIAFITLSLLTFIIYNYYTSIVVAILLGTPVKSNIKTIGQLADSSLDVGMVPTPYTKTYLFSSTLPEVIRLVGNKIKSRRPNEVWISVNEGLTRVRDDPGFVFVIDSISGYILIEQLYTDKELCDLNEILLREPKPLYQHLHKNSSYRQIVMLKQLRILEAGIARRHHQLWIKKHLDCYLSSNVLVQVGLEYTAPLFIMLAATYILCWLLMIFEILWKKFEIKFKIGSSESD